MARSVTVKVPAAPVVGPAVTRTRTATKPLGASGQVLVGAGLWAQSWPMLSYNPSQLLGRQGIDLFDKMLLDDQIKAAISFKTESVLATGWQVASPDEMPADWPVTQFVARRLDRIANSFDRSLRNILTSMIYGYSITEIVYEAIPEGEDAGFIGAKFLKTRSPHMLRFKMDEFGNITHIINDQDNTEYRNDAKFIIFSYGDSFGNPYGQSELEACYRAYILANNSYRWLGQYLERLGVPPWFALYNPATFQDPMQMNDLKSIMKNLQNATSAAIPRASKDDFEIWSPTSIGNVQGVFIPALQHLKADIARALLMPGHLGMSPEQQQGSFAKARVALDMFLLSLTSIQGHLREIIQNQLVRPLVDLNFTTNGVYPNFQFLPLADEDVQAIVSAWSELVDRDIVSVDDDDEQHLRALLKFPRADDEDEPDDQEEKPRIPLRYLEKLTRALKVDEVRRALDLDPLGGEEGDKLLVEPTEAADALAQVDAAAKAAAAEASAKALAAGAANGQPDNPAAPGATAAANDDDEEEEEPTPAAKQKPAAAHAAPTADEADEVEIAIPEADAPGLTKAERRCDFAAMVARLNGLEDEITASLARALRTALRAQIDSWLTKPPTMANANKVKAAMPPSAESTVLRALKRVLAFGRTHCREEAAKGPQTFAEASLPTYEPAAALDYLSAKTDFVVAGLSSRLTEILRAELLFGLRNGLPYTEVRDRILGALALYIGAVDADPAVLRPDRLLTVVRTNATDAYNQGRVIEARRLGTLGLVTGMQHSSVMDDVTTAICKSLQGRCYRINDSALDTMTPPLHFRCRSILLPIVLSDEISSDANDPEHWATPEEIGAAKRLIPGEFGGSFTATKKNAPK